jgi:hypothetical protein
VSHIIGVPFTALIGQRITAVKHGAPDRLMPKINPYNAYTITTDTQTFIVWNSHGETNLSEVRE